MSAEVELLDRAAEALRKEARSHRPGGKCERTFTALAALFDDEAAEARHDHSYPNPYVVDIARAYLGESS